MGSCWRRCGAVEGSRGRTLARVKKKELPMTLSTLLVLLLAAFVTATISAILGMGGGITLLGVMTALLPPPVVVPLHGMVQLSSNLTRTWAYRKHIRWPIFIAYAVPALVGMGLATRLYSGTKMVWFRPIIGVLIWLFLLTRKRWRTLTAPPRWMYAPLGLVVGLVAIFIGATGPLLAPFFLRSDFSKENIIATKAVCQSWLHLLKIPAFLAVGFNYLPHLRALAMLMLAVVGGTYMGKYLLDRIPRERFFMLFQVVLGLLALVLIVRGAGPLWAHMFG